MNRMEFTPPKGMKRVYLDIMINGRFVCQLPYDYCELFPDDEETVKEYCQQKRPSLRGKKFNVAFTNNRVLY